MKSIKLKSTIILLLALIVSVCAAMCLVNVGVPASAQTNKTFTMEDGAAIRTVSGEEGIRFTAEMTPAYYEDVAGKAKEDTTVEYGMCIKEGDITAENLIGGASADAGMYKPMKSDGWYSTFNPENKAATKYVYKFAIIGINVLNYNSPISALAYVKYTDKTTNEVCYDYALDANSNYDVQKRSIFQVAIDHAQFMEDDATETKFINDLLAAVVDSNEDITLSTSSFTLKQGDKVALPTVTVGGVEVTPELAITDSSVATIENGEIVAVDSSATEAKTTTLTATIGNYSASATIKVKGEISRATNAYEFLTAKNGVYSWDVEDLEKATFNGFSTSLDVTEQNSLDVIEYGVKVGNLKNGNFSVKFVFETSDLIVTEPVYTGVQGVSTAEELLNYINVAARRSTYYLLNDDIYIESSNPSGAILTGQFKGTFNGNGHKVIVNKTVAPTVSNTAGVSYGILFDAVMAEGVIKNTQFDITYHTTQTAYAERRIGPLAANLYGTIQDCYIKTTRIQSEVADWDDSSIVDIARDGSKLSNLIVETENRRLSRGKGNMEINNVLVVSAKAGASQGTSGFARNLTNQHGFTNVSVYESMDNLLAGTGVKVTDGVISNNTTENITNTPQYNSFSSKWTFDTTNGIVAFNGNDVTNALGATYSAGVFSWNDLGATSTEIYVDGEKRQIALTEETFAVADYLIDNEYDLSVAHSVAIKVTDGTYSYSAVISVKVTTVADETGFRAIGNANDYYLLTSNITIEDTATTAMISTFGGILDGNGYKVTITRSVVPESPTNGYSVLFGTVSESAVIKRTQFEINYTSNIKRAAPFASTFNGLLTNCYIESNRTDYQGTSYYEESSLIYNLGGTLKNNIFVGANKHIIGWEVANSGSRIEGALIVFSSFSRVGKISGSYCNISNVSRYTTMTNMLLGTGTIYTSDGSTVTNTSITTTPQYTGVFDSTIWNFNAAAGTITLCGKTVG